MPGHTFVANFLGDASEAVLRYRANDGITKAYAATYGDGLANFQLQVNGQVTADDVIAQLGRGSRSDEVWSGPLSRRC